MNENEVTPDSPEARFIRLMSDLFQLHEAEALDFGIYRVIKRHNKKVRDFLGAVANENGARVLQGGELAGILEEAFQHISSESVHEKKMLLQRMGLELGVGENFDSEKRIQHLMDVEKIPAMRQKVADYRALRDELFSTYHADADRSEVLNRLYEFFSRHYQDGDFIVQRRYGRNGARYIPSTGEDTEFHWATEEMYYIKSGDIFTDYPVRLSNGQQLVFCVHADTLNQTRAELRPTDKASYKLRAVDASLVKAKTATASIRVILDYLKGAQTKARMDEIVTQAATATNAASEEVARHLRRYIARNQSDFFIHKRLKEALDDDLDIFIKTEVLNADQLLAEDAGNIPDRAIRVARVIRQIGRRINAFLGVLEDFQKRLWEKKKLVLATRYVITLDRLDKLAGREFIEAHIAAILANSAQIAEWKTLGLGEFAKVEAVKRNDGGYLPLPVDTLHFSDDFKWLLLAAVTKNNPLDESLDGVAIHSDNWQALNTMQEKYWEQVKCIYIDPPYNTGGDGFPYKDAYPHASWLAMIQDRLQVATPFMNRTSALFASIDHVERNALFEALAQTLGRRNRVEEIIWGQNSTKNQSPTFSTNHEYIEVFARDLAAASNDQRMFREPKPGAIEILELMDQLNQNYPSITEIENEIKALFDRHRIEFRSELDESGIEYDKTLDSWKGLYNYHNAEYRDEFGYFVPETQAKERQAKIWVWREDNPSMPQVKADSQKEEFRDSKHASFRFYKPIHPVTGLPCPPPKRGWVWPYLPQLGQSFSFSAFEKDQRIVWGVNEKKIPQLKKFLHEVDTQVSKSLILDYTDGEKELTHLTGKTRSFPSPKPTTLIERFILQTTDVDDWVMDFFAGSGTTFHAAISARHDDRQRRRVLLVENGSHFNMVLMSRIKRVSAAWVWKNGIPLAINGPGLFMRVQRLEQYEDTLENLAVVAGENQDLFSGPKALAYDLDAEARRLLLASRHFSAPFGLTLKRIAGAEVETGPVDLVESLIYLLGLRVERLYREQSSVVITGLLNRSQQTAAVFWRDNVLHGADWLQTKMAEHPADRYYTNDPAGLSFPGIERFTAIETVFVEEMNGGRP